MRQRITFVHEPQDAIDPKGLDITSTGLSLAGLEAAREDRITLGLAELTRELRMVLGQAQELHIRYVRPAPYKMIPPFNSRVSPGLHVYYSAKQSGREESEEEKSDLLCPLIDQLFDLQDKALCQTPEKSFTSLDSQNSQHSTEYEYYLRESQISPKGGASTLADYVKGFCTNPSCQQRVEKASDAAYIDLDFSTDSHTVTITAFWEPQTWDAGLLKINPQDRLEVGILSNEKPVRVEELNMAGFLTVVGEDDKAKPTMFSFPARHHQHASSFSASFLQPTGLHPSLSLSISNSLPPPDHSSCALHAHLTLPRSIFADKYQLKDPLFMASKNLTAVRHITTPVDLEAPEYAMSLWGSSVLLELAPPAPADASWTAEIPLHLRYLAPTESGYSRTSLPSPVVFWACAAEGEKRFTGSPFDRTELGYDGLFEPETVFYHLSPEDGEGYSEVSVPVLSTRFGAQVEMGTAVVVMLGFGWVLWKLWGVWRGEGYGSGSGGGDAGKVAAKEE